MRQQTRTITASSPAHEPAAGATVSPVKRDPSAVAASSPSLRASLVAPVAPEAAESDAKRRPLDAKRNRLLRHRESCHRSYNKKVTTISALKQELETLEATYNALLSRDAGAKSAPTAKTSRLEAYKELARVRRDLVLQNEELYRLNAASMILEGRLQQVLDVDAPVATCELPDDVLRFANSPNKLSLQASVFGWTDYRQEHGNELKFALEKQFPALSALEVVDRTWRVVSSEELCAQLFNPSLQAKLETLQHVDADTILMYRTIHADALGVMAKSVFLLSRMSLPDGYLVLFRSIDPRLVGFDDEALVNEVIEEARQDAQRSVQLLGPGDVANERVHREVWVEKYAWALVHETGPRSCRFHFGGSTMTNVWLKEILFVALRWEKMAIGPAFLLDV